MGVRQPVEGPVGRAVVDDDDLDGDGVGPVPGEARQAGLQQRAAVVGRDDHRADGPGQREGLRLGRAHEVLPQATCWMVMKSTRKSNQNDQRWM